MCDALEISGILCLFFVWFRGFSPEKDFRRGSECGSARPRSGKFAFPDLGAFKFRSLLFFVVFRLRGCLILEAKFYSISHLREF